MILDNKNEIDADAMCSISSSDATPDSGGPNFSYSELKLKNGNGTYTWVSVSDGYYGDDENSSVLYQWAKDHGHYYLSNEIPGFSGGYSE